jgi:hypothetical protein
MPSRIIREGIISSPRINSLSLGAEVLYRRLMSIADDYGRFYGSVMNLRVSCFPTNPERFREKEVGKWFNELLRGEEPLVKTYPIGGITYLEIQGFGQQIRGKSKFPAPPWFENQRDTEKSAKQLPESPVSKREADVQPSRSRISESYSESYSESCNTQRTPQTGVLAIVPDPKPQRPKKAGRTIDQVRADLGIRLPWFEALCSVHPAGKDGVKAGMEAFERKVSADEAGHQLAREMYRGATAYAAKCAADPTIKVKWLQGWINDERWTDENRAREPTMPVIPAAQLRRAEVVRGFDLLDEIRRT